MSKTIKIIISHERNIYKDLITNEFSVYGKNHVKTSMRNITSDVLSGVIFED